MSDDVRRIRERDPMVLLHDTDLEKLANEYVTLWGTCIPERRQETDVLCHRILASRSRYWQVGQELRLPWFWVACVHALEANGDFTKHLHNGDPLTGRTVHVPAGRPAKGKPPFAWEASAIDALVTQNVDQIPEWTIPVQLWALEKWNGWGYRKKDGRPPSPYLWAGSNIERAGKFTADGKFSADALSRQIGAAVILKRLATHHGVQVDAYKKPRE